MKKTLGQKNMLASISIGDELIIPYNNSQVFAEISEDSSELYVLIKNTQDESKNIKLFFKEGDLEYTEVKE